MPLRTAPLRKNPLVVMVAELPLDTIEHAIDGWPRLRGARVGRHVGVLSRRAPAHLDPGVPVRGDGDLEATNLVELLRERSTALLDRFAQALTNLDLFQVDDYF